MKPFNAVIRNAVALTAAACVSLCGNAVHAQDSAFLACARHSDRGDRIACLEDALDAALAAQEAQQRAQTPAQPQASTPAQVPPAAPAVAEVPAPPVQPTAPAAAPANTAPPAPTAANTETEERSSLLDRIRSFGRDDEATASISTDDSGKDRLHDTIAALEKRNELWTVTLSSGQVWRQVYPRTLNLRAGDEISIYQEGIGDGYRLATPRLSGFIRVERTK
jgi:type IV secretory pathway VirB10-like protein